MTKRQKQVRIHNAATLLALLSFAGVVLVSAELFGLSISLPLAMVSVLLMFSSILVTFATRNADEYTAAMWRAGTSLAFVITAAVMLFAPLAEGFHDGLTQAHGAGVRKRELQIEGIIIVIAAFFVGNAWARIRGTA